MKYTVKPEYLDQWGEDTYEDTIITESDLEMIAHGWEKDVEDLKDQLIEVEEEDDEMKVQFMAGEGRSFQGGVNYLLSTDGRLYAEVAVPEGASDDYGYLTMAKAIQEKADQIGLNLEDYRFQYDGQEDYLEDDADADCDVYLEVE